MSAILEQHKSSFAADPSNRQAFEALEEHLFMSGMWNELVSLYNRRLEAPEFASEPANSIPILFRLAQVLEERALAVDRALETYWKVAKLDPSFRPALRQLRQIYAQREQWDMLLQIAEMEEQLEMSTHEKASFLAELGDVWNGKLNDPTEALIHYQKALALASDHIPALTGLARVHEGLGHHDQAAAALERLTDRMRGPDRAPILVSLGIVLDKHLDQSARAIECFQLALTDDPRCAAAVEALSHTATRLEDWLLVAKLYERRFDIASGARKRVGIAVEAGRLNLERLNDTQAARMWLDRALDFGGTDAPVYDAIAELERRTGNRDALRNALDELISLEGENVCTSVLVEAADLYSEAGDEEKAVTLLRQAQVREPDNSLVIETLSDSLAQLGLDDELVDVLEQRAALTDDDPQSASEIYAEIGRIRLEHLDDFDAGMASLIRAFDLDATTAGVASQLERLYRKNEDWNGLRSVLERAGREGPTGKRAHCLASLGEVLEQRFDDEEGALTAFESALDLDPECALAHQGVERIIHASGNQDELLRICEREAEITSDRTRMGELVWTMLPLLEERERTEDALGWAEKLNQLCPDDRKTLLAIVGLRETLGQPEQLQQPLEQLDRILSGNEQTSNRRKLARLHLDAGHREQAIEWFVSALDGDPSHLDSLRSLKTLYSDTRDFESMARTMRRLADALPDREGCDELGELSNLLADQIGDIEGAIVVLWRLAKLPADVRPDDVDERLETLLERAGRFEELVQQLLQRRRPLEDGSEAARELDLRRAKLLLDDLGQYEEAASLYGSLRVPEGEHEGEPEDCDEAILDGLEKALRLGNNAEGLVDLLADLAEHETDPMARANLEMERATLLEETLGAFDEARIALTKLAERQDAREIADQAGVQLERLLTRSGDWEALRARLSERLGAGSQEDDLALHEELALLSRDRFGEREACVEHLEAAGKIAPDRQPIWHNLAVLYGDLDRPEDLLRVLEHELSLGLDPEREIMLHSRAARLANDLEGREQSCSEHYEHILRLEPGHPEATEYLLEFYDRESRPEDMVRLLRARLDASLESDEPADVATASTVSLRLRISALESGALDDDEAAVATLAPAIDEAGLDAAITTPLAELYLRLGQRAEYIALCQRAADHCEQPEERAGWLLRTGDALRQDNEPERAIEAYGQVLTHCPDDPDAQSALRELYRKARQFEPLAALLRKEIKSVSDQTSLPLRLELAILLAGPLDRRDSSLEVFNEILLEDPRHPEAFVHALHLNIELERHEETQQLLERGLAGTDAPTARAALLERLADLEAGPLDAPATALGRYREALSLDSSRTSISTSMCRILTDLGRWTELLDCLYLEAQRATGDERRQIYERAIEIAIREVSSDAALPWLERLHVAAPDDAEVLSRMADIHRQAGRPEALLRSLEAQLSLQSTPSELHALHCGIAKILERDLAAPGRAVQALEAAHAIEADDPDLLADLDRLYDALGRYADRARVIDERIACPGTQNDQLATLHGDAAELWQSKLSSSETATRHLLHSLNLSDPNSSNVLPVTRKLQQSLRATGRLDGWARAAEFELERLIATRDPVHDARRYELHSELANCCEHVLARPALAQRHLLALLDDWNGEEPLSQDQIDTAEVALIHHLRRECNHVELERRLSRRLDRTGGSAEEWLELAVLQQERMHRPSAARRAFRMVLERRPECLDAIRGLRGTSEALRDWLVVAESLDLELALDDTQDTQSDARTAQESSLLLCRLGEISWKQLQTDDALERASRAYCENLVQLPDDLESVRALQQIEEERGEFEAAISRYLQEIDILGDNESDRRQVGWLRVAELSLDKTDDLERSIEAYASAAECGELTLSRLREWAELYRTAENWERFAEVFGQWCDAPDSPSDCSDFLLLVDVLVELGHDDRALECAQRAIEADPTRATGSLCAAELCERRGEVREAVEHLSRAAELSDAANAIDYLLRAAQMVSEHDPERGAALLRRAAEHDAGSQEVQARLAIVCERLELWEEAETTAARALDSTADRALLADGLLLNTALAGGRAAWRDDAVESAIRLFSAARELAPENVEALDALGELLHRAGDVRAARDVLGDRLSMSGDNPKAGLQLAIVGEALELDEDFARALETYLHAIESEPSQDHVRDGIVRIHLINEDQTAAIAALDEWIEILDDVVKKSAQLARAAALEQGEEAQAALSRLREATDIDPMNAVAWTMLADLLLSLEQPDEALEAATSGLAVIDSADRESVATLAYIRGYTLEQSGEETEAATAYGLSVENDDTQAEAVLAQSRLLQNTGEWEHAARVLGSFLDNHPEPTSAMLAQVYYKRGGLLAGPLEEIEEAIRSYESAITLDADFSRAIEPLANLLGHFPERWEEAVRQHRALLQEDPARESSIRSLIAISEQRGDDSSKLNGLAILRALGAVSSDELMLAPDRLGFKLAETPRLSDPHAERLRKMVVQAREEISQALRGLANRDAASEPAPSRLEPAQQAFLDAVGSAVDELSAAGFDGLEAPIIGETVGLVAAMALDVARPEVDSEIASRLDGTIGRWARRKLRKCLEGTDHDEVEKICWEDWWQSLRTASAAVALDRLESDLRCALLALSAENEDTGAEQLTESENIADRVRSREPAYALLRCVTRAWCAQIGR